MTHFDVIVVGGGASGLMAAGTAAKNGAKVCLLEKMFMPGRKLRITGKGRCNLTNLTTVDDFLTHIGEKGAFLKPAFSQFFAPELISFFNSIHVKTKTERGRRVFPQSDKAQDIVDGLVKWVRKTGVLINNDCTVKKLIVKDGKIEGVQYANGKSLFASKVILCTGGASYPATGSSGDGYRISKQIGHTVTPILPALVPILVKEQFVNRLEKLSLRNIAIKIFEGDSLLDEKFGEMQFLKGSVSGPIILSLSRTIGPKLMKEIPLILEIDLKPALSEIKLTNRFNRELDKNPSLQLRELIRKLMPSQMVAVFIGLLKIDANKYVSKLDQIEIKKIILLLKNFRLNLSGLGSFKEAIITAGGIKLDEVNPETMESRKIKDLYFAGEILDLDADTGGYNLQIAFSTGRLAALSATYNLK